MSTLDRPNRRDAFAEVLVNIVAARGLDQVSVREVAAGMGVSIGAVQHYFATKSEMLTFAFRHAVRRTRRRLAALELSGDRAADAAAVLQQLLPLDEVRRVDATINLSFAAYAPFSPDFQAIQRELLAGIRRELVDVLGAGREAEAVMLLAAVDGLAMHELSAPGGLGPAAMIAALDVAIDAACGETTAGG